MKLFKKPKSFIVIALLSFVSALAMSALSAVVLYAAEAIYTINSNPAFQANDGNNIYKCYRISGSGNEKKIAVGWGKDASEAPSTLNVPSLLYNSSNPLDITEYTVVAIARGGFRNCVFKKITLPQTVEEIREGAFAYCENLSDIMIPHLVSVIDDSTFLDCRSLKSIMYSEKTSLPGAEIETYAATTSNNVIKRIEDHAFDSCVSLIQFECPKSLVYIGKSAFQYCKKMTRFYLPDKPSVYDETINGITIDKYAFADCSNLEWVYFEENLVSVKDYAFVDCKTNLLFHFAYDTSGEEKDNPEFDTYWRRKSLKSDNYDVYDFEEDANGIIRTADGYLGLKVGIEYTSEKLNSFNINSTDKSTNEIEIVPASKHAVIYQWDNPGQRVQKAGDDFAYYDIASGKNADADGSGILTIPSSVTVEGVTADVKVIKEEAFKNATVLKEIHFKNNIVQIQRKAFIGCTYVDTIDFSNVTTLKEIGCNLFTEGNTKNTKFNGVLSIPYSVVYIGPNAFRNFTKATGLTFNVDGSGKSYVELIGGNAFYNIGSEINDSYFFDLTLPCSLKDANATKANMNSTGNNWASVGPNAFSSKAILTITMQSCDHGTHNSNQTSFACNAFDSCSNLVKFTANRSLCRIGKNAFNKCGALKEMFLTTAKATSYANGDSNRKFVWGADKGDCKTGGSIFGNDDKGQAFPNLVIYLDGNVPTYLDTYNNSGDTSGVIRWNSESRFLSSFSTGLGTTNTEQGRRIIPTYTNVDFTKINQDSLIYFNVPTTGSLTSRNTSPTRTSEYFSGILSFVKQGGKYTVAHYYANHSNARQEFDLTNLTYTYNGGANSVDISSNLTAIGAGAFASDRNSTTAQEAQAPCPGKYFVLPSSVKTIAERAFYRLAANEGSETAAQDVVDNGVAIVTTKTDSVLGGAGDTYANIKSNFSTNKYGYCNIPNVTLIENGAFFNNVFKTVDLSNSLIGLGRSAFYTRYGSKLDTITFASGDNDFEEINYGIYYTGGDSSQKTLVYQAQNDTTVTKLTIDDDTYAVAPAAVTNTAYTTVDLNDVKQIYGSSFQNNGNLTTIEGGSDLEYIGAYPYAKTAYKIEKYKYFIGQGAQTEHVDDLSQYGTSTLGYVSPGPSVTVSFKEEGNTNTLWPFPFSGGDLGNITLYGQHQTLQTETLIYQIPSTSDDSDILNSSMPFKLTDYRATSNIEYANIVNRVASFKDNKNLSNVDFRSLTNLKKIGHAAFMGCTNLTNVNLGTTYRYYSYNMSTHRVSISATKTSNVLDLSKCSKLLSIGNGAFNGCTQIQYAHLPYTDGRLFVQSDPQTPFYGTSQKVFSNNGIKILIGDKEIKSNDTTHDKFGGLKLHYPFEWYGSNTPYYYTSGNGEKDLYAKAPAVHYWTQNVTKDSIGYILFDSYAQAYDYYANLPTVEANWPSIS